MLPQATGRPPTGRARVKSVETRMSEKELRLLDSCCEVLEETRSAVIRKGVALLHTKITKSNEDAPV